MNDPSANENVISDDVDTSEEESLDQIRFAYGLDDSNWNEDRWSDLLDKLVNDQILTWRDIATLVLGHLNPSQVGTQLASSAGFKRRYGKGQVMRVV